MCDFTLPEDIIDLLEGDSAVCHGIDSLSCPSVFTESLTEEFSCTKLKDSSLVGATVGRLFKMKEGLIYYYDETGQNLKHKHHPVANGTTIEVDRKKMSITLKTKLDGKTLTLSDFKNISLIGGKDAKSADELLDLVEKRIKYHSAICEIRSRMGIKLYAELVQGKFNPPHTLFEPGTPTLEKAKKVLSQLRSMMDSEPLIEFRDNGGAMYWGGRHTISDEIDHWTSLSLLHSHVLPQLRACQPDNSSESSEKETETEMDLHSEAIKTFIQSTEAEFQSVRAKANHPDCPREAIIGDWNRVSAGPCRAMVEGVAPLAFQEDEDIDEYTHKVVQACELCTQLVGPSVRCMIWYHDAAKFHAYRCGDKDDIKELFQKSEREGQAVIKKEGKNLKEKLRLAIEAIDEQRRKFLAVVEVHLL